jgi:hypothetical protein
MIILTSESKNKTATNIINQFKQYGYELNFKFNEDLDCFIFRYGDEEVFALNIDRLLFFSKLSIEFHRDRKPIIFTKNKKFENAINSYIISLIINSYKVHDLESRIKMEINDVNFVAKQRIKSEYHTNIIFNGIGERILYNNLNVSILKGESFSGSEKELQLRYSFSDESVKVCPFSNRAKVKINFLKNGSTEPLTADDFNIRRTLGMSQKRIDDLNLALAKLSKRLIYASSFKIINKSENQSSSSEKLSNGNDLILEKLEYAIGLNPSSHIRDELDKMKSEYIAEKEAEIKRKEQEKRDTEAERILITLKNYYVRGESIEEERIN